jgi:hypothetical protein
MAPDEKCLEHARECVRFAGLSEDQQTRDRLFDIAREWMAAAMDGQDCDPIAEPGSRALALQSGSRALVVSSTR